MTEPETIEIFGETCQASSGAPRYWLKQRWIYDGTVHELKSGSEFKWHVSLIWQTPFIRRGREKTPQAAADALNAAARAHYSQSAWFEGDG